MTKLSRICVKVSLDLVLAWLREFPRPGPDHGGGSGSLSQALGPSGDSLRFSETEESSIAGERACDDEARIQKGRRSIDVAPGDRRRESGCGLEDEPGRKIGPGEDQFILSVEGHRQWHRRDERHGVPVSRRDRNDATLRRIGHAGLTEVVVSPSDDAAVVLQGHAVTRSRGDGGHSTRGGGGHNCLTVEIVSPGDDAAVIPQGHGEGTSRGDGDHPALSSGGHRG